MRLSVADLQQYRVALERIGQSASNRVVDSLAGHMTTRNEAREVAIDAINESIGVEGDMAQSLAGLLFDEICYAEGIDADAAVLFDDLIDQEMLAKKVYYFSRRLVEGDKSGFAQECGNLANFYTWRLSREAMVRNCERNGVRYARIPTNDQPCDWCVMLASRGFVYHSADAAEAGGHVHCMCICVPGGDSTTVEGYNPNEYYSMWRSMIGSKAASRAKSKGTTVATERAAIIARYEAASARSKKRNRLR